MERSKENIEQFSVFFLFLSPEGSHVFYLSRAIDVHYYCVFSLNYFTSLVYFLPHFFLANHKSIIT